MAYIPTTETLDPNGANISVPNLLTSINTNSGVTSNPSAFGADISGLASGIQKAAGTVEQIAEKRQETTGRLWALQQGTQMQVLMHQDIAEAMESGSPINPQEFTDKWNKWYMKQVNGAPSSDAAAYFQQHATGLFRWGVDQAISTTAKYNVAEQSRSAQQVLNRVASNVSGAPWDTLNKSIDEISNALGEIPGVKSAAEQAHAQVAGSMIKKVAKTKGGNQAAAEIAYNDLGGKYLNPSQKAIAINQLNTQGENDDAAQKFMSSIKFDSVLHDQATSQNLTNGQIMEAVGSKQLSDTEKTKYPLPSFTDKMRPVMQEKDDLTNRLTKTGKSFLIHQINSIFQARSEAVIRSEMSGMDMNKQAAFISEVRENFPDNPHMLAAAQGYAKYAHTVLSDRKSDAYAPCDFVLQGQPDVMTKWTDYQNSLQDQTPDGQGKSKGLWNIYKSTVIPAQQRATGQTGSEHLWSETYAKQMADNITDDSKFGKFISSTMQQYGDEDGRSIVSQVAEKKGTISPIIKLAALNPMNKEVANAISYKPDESEKKKEVMDVYENEMNGNSTLKKYFNSTSLNPKSGEENQAVRQGLIQLTQYLASGRNAIGKKEMMQKAIELTIGNAFSVVDGNNSSSLSVPKRYAQTDSDLKVLQDNANKLNLAGYSARVLNVKSLGFSSEFDTKKAISNGVWKYDANRKSLQLFAQGSDLNFKPVLLEDGRPLAYKIDKLNGPNVSDILSGNEHNSTSVPIFDYKTKEDSYVAGIDNENEIDKGGRIVRNIKNRVKFNLDQLIPEADKPAQPDPVPFKIPEVSKPTSSLEEKLPEPMKPLAKTFEDAASRYGLDPKLLAAISMHETGKGTSQAFNRLNNAMGISNDSGVLPQHEE